MDELTTHVQAKSIRTVKKGKKNKDGQKASKSALVIFRLQQRLPNARVVYSSATIATRLVCKAGRCGCFVPKM